MDDNGNAANHTETELIVYLNIDNHNDKSIMKFLKVYSHVQVRGSMPFFWQQPSLTDIQLIGSVELSIRPFLLHFKELNQSYNGGKIACLNLVAGKGKENTLKSRYESIMKQTNLKQAQYFYFDFHLECAENSDPMMHMLKSKVYPEQIEPGGIFCEHQYILRQDSGSTKVATYVESKQSGILRTNCIDCLDRTNIAQFMASKLVL